MDEPGSAEGQLETCGTDGNGTPMIFDHASLWLLCAILLVPSSALNCPSGLSKTDDIRGAYAPDDQKGLVTGRKTSSPVVVSNSRCSKVQLLYA